MNHRTEFQSNNVDLQNIVTYAGAKIDEQTELIKKIKKQDCYLLKFEGVE